MAEQDIRRLLKDLQNLRREILDKNGGPMRKALRAGARLVRDEARRLVARSDGDGPHLQDQIIIYRQRNPDPAVFEHFRVLVKFKARKYTNRRFNQRLGRAGKKYQHTGDFYYWRFLELGTSQMPAKPFLRPAMDNNKDKIDALVKATLAKAIAKAFKK